MNFIKRITKLLKLIKNKTWRKGLFNKIAANIELEDLIKDLKFETIIDVGSNKGQFILLIEGLYKNKNIYSFEPIDEIFKKQKDFFQYKQNIYFFNFGIGSAKSTKDFYITNRKDSSSFLQVKDLKSDDYKVKENRSTIIKTLDDVFTNINLIKHILLKIDVQGYELEVLKGSKNLLKKIKYIIVETSQNKLYSNQPVKEDVIEFLNQNNFVKHRENQPTKIKNYNIIQSDILFKNKSIND